jgi:hypothetical protein
LLRANEHAQDQQQTETKSSLDHHGPPFLQLNSETSLLCKETYYKIQKDPGAAILNYLAAFMRQGSVRVRQSLSRRRMAHVL